MYYARQVMFPQYYADTHQLHELYPSHPIPSHLQSQLNFYNILPHPSPTSLNRNDIDMHAYQNDRMPSN